MIKFIGFLLGAAVGYFALAAGLHLHGVDAPWWVPITQMLLGWAATLMIHGIIRVLESA